MRAVDVIWKTEANAGRLKTDSHDMHGEGQVTETVEGIRFWLDLLDFKTYTVRT